MTRVHLTAPDYDDNIGAGMSPLPASALAILQALEGEQVHSMEDIRRRTGLCRRTAFSGIRYLLERGLARRVRSLRDVRRVFFMSMRRSTTSDIQPETISNGATTMSKTANATSDNGPATVNRPSERAEREAALRARFFPSKMAMEVTA